MGLFFFPSSCISFYLEKKKIKHVSAPLFFFKEIEWLHLENQADISIYNKHVLTYDLFYINIASWIQTTVSEMCLKALSKGIEKTGQKVTL